MATIGRRMRVVALAAIVVAGVAAARSARADGTPIPAAPTQFVTDRAGFLSPGFAAELTRQLEDYQRGTGHQLIVWIDRTLGGEPLEDWTAKAFKAWGVGRKEHNDGVALFIFSDDRKLRIEVGYGLEGNVPDARAGRIIQNDMVPRIRAGDRDGAVKAGVDSLIAAIGGAPEPARPATRGIAAVRVPSDLVLHPRVLPGAATSVGAAVHRLRSRRRRLGRRRRRLGRRWRRRRIFGRRRQLGRRRRVGRMVTPATASRARHRHRRGRASDPRRGAAHLRGDPRRGRPLLVLGRRPRRGRAPVQAAGRLADTRAQRRADLRGAAAAQAGGAGRRRHPGEGRARAMGGGDRQDGRRFSPRGTDGRPGRGRSSCSETRSRRPFPVGADDVNELTNSVSVDER